jgi:hypothetical protein
MAVLSNKTIRRLLEGPSPIRDHVVHYIKKYEWGSYEFRVGIGAVDRPQYAHIIYNAADLAKRLGYPKISVIEFGVAGGNGLVAMERHAERIEKLFSIEIEVYGFDRATGLPHPIDYRDFPYAAAAGMYVMDVDKLRRRLTRSKLVIGDIEQTVRSFFADYNPAPIGAIAYDMDYYSSTIDSLKMFDMGEENFLPRSFCYFDDTVSDTIDLCNDYIGERLAIEEFNRAHEFIKVTRPYYFLLRAPQIWHHQIWVTHMFKHGKYNSLVLDIGAQDRLELRS